MKPLLAGFCLLVLGVMLAVTIVASLQQDVLTALGQLWPDPWFRATLADAYFGFLFFWLWLAWREGTVARGALWFVLVMSLGNFAMAGYLLLQLRHWDPAEGIEGLLLGRRHGNRR